MILIYLGGTDRLPRLMRTISIGSTSSPESEEEERGDRAVSVYPDTRDFQEELSRFLGPPRDPPRPIENEPARAGLGGGLLGLVIGLSAIAQFPTRRGHQASETVGDMWRGRDPSLDFIRVSVDTSYTNMERALAEHEAMKKKNLPRKKKLFMGRKNVPPPVRFTNNYPDKQRRVIRMRPKKR